MTEKSFTEYSAFDRPEITNFLFFPRQEDSSYGPPEGYSEIFIPVDHNVAIGSRLYAASKESPIILFFHGNGEIVGDYHDLGAIYVDMGISFLPIDYRGYGKSTGSPCVSSMMKDAHDIFNFVLPWLSEHGFTGKIVVMGRSLGSASALELADHYEAMIDGLIIESGFARALPLLNLLGIDTHSLGLTEDGFRNMDKIKSFEKPTLILHAEYDQIIPFGDGQLLYNSSHSKQKKMVRIPGADHNTIFYYGFPLYMASVKNLILSL